MSRMNRRTFIKGLGAATAMAAAPFSLVEIAWGRQKEESFTFAYISDAHINHIKGTEFTRNFDKGLERAVAEVNFLFPQPDFVVFGGDLAQLGKKEELDHGLELMSKVKAPVKWVIGEHDYYLDLGKYWEETISPLYYSFDHKGVHFVVLNSILTDDQWTHEKWPSPMERMKQMARLDNPQGSPFMVKEEQRKWLARDLEPVDRSTPVVVLSHSPLYQVFKPWNFWTDDAAQVQEILRPFDRVHVFHGHVHQVLYNQIGNISFAAFLATAWPWPYPVSYTQEPNAVPGMTVFMNRADPHSERDGTGYGSIELDDGFAKHYELWENRPRRLRSSKQKGHPVDTNFQAPDSRIPPQRHY